MTLVADGDLKSVGARDLLRRAATTQGECVVIITAAGGSYRFVLRDGRFLWAARGRVHADLRAYLQRFQIRTEEAIEQLEVQAASHGRPFVLEALRSLAGEDSLGLVRAFIADVVFDFVHETTGTFVASIPATPIPTELEAAIEIDSLLAEIDRRLGEERSASEWLPAKRSTIRWMPTAEAPSSEHAGEIQRALAAGPLPFDDIVRRVPADTHTLRIALAHMNRLGIVQVEAATPTPPVSVDCDETRCYRTATVPLALDDRIVLTSVESKLLSQLAARPISAGELGADLDRRSLVHSTLAYLEALGVVEGQTSSSSPVGSYSPIGRGGIDRRLALGVAAAIGLLAVALFAGYRGSTSDAVAVDRAAPPAAGKVPQYAGPQAVALGLKALLDDDLEAAKRHAMKAELLQPNTEEVADLRARIRSIEGERARQAAEAAEIDRERLRRSDRLIGRALQALESGDRTAAADALAEAATLDPGSDEIRQLMRRTLRPVRPTKSRPAQPPPTSEPTAAVAASSTPPAIAEVVSSVPAETTSAPEPATLEPTVKPVEPPNTRLLVNAVPWGTVLLDGVEAGITPLLLSPPPGEHVLEVVREGYETERRSVRVVDGIEAIEAFVLTARLDPAEGTEVER